MFRTFSPRDFVRLTYLLGTALETVGLDEQVEIWEALASAGKVEARSRDARQAPFVGMADAFLHSRDGRDLTAM